MVTSSISRRFGSGLFVVLLCAMILASVIIVPLFAPGPAGALTLAQTKPPSSTEPGQPMTDTNKLLFAFAAYNADPGRVHSLRTEAAQKGLDPSVWIDNVEMIAAARIGMEAVTHVANIYKYYIAYKLVAEQEEERTKALQQLQCKPGS
jgi:hypothetical protein